MVILSVLAELTVTISNKLSIKITRKFKKEFIEEIKTSKVIYTLTL
jgi:hypothetical protein